MGNDTEFDEFDDRLELAIESKTSRLSLNEVNKRQRAERLLTFSLLIFCLMVGVIGWYTEGNLFSSAWTTLQRWDSGAETSDPTLSCQLAKNKNTPFCVERAARVKSNWQSITRNERGKANAFTLHGK